MKHLKEKGQTTVTHPESGGRQRAGLGRNLSLSDALVTAFPTSYCPFFKDKEYCGREIGCFSNLSMTSQSIKDHWGGPVQLNTLLMYLYPWRAQRHF